MKGYSSYLAARLPDADIFTWQREYGILSVSEFHLPTIIRYVQRQQQHHAKGTIHTVLELTTQE